MVDELEATTKSENEDESEHQDDGAAELERGREEDVWQPIHSEVTEVKNLVNDLTAEVKACNQRAQEQTSTLEQLIATNQELTKKLEESSERLVELSTQASSTAQQEKSGSKGSEEKTSTNDPPEQQPPPKPESNPPERARRRRRSI
jgi:uncharacterized coiled-coil DUF342 family protein